MPHARRLLTVIAIAGAFVSSTCADSHPIDYAGETPLDTRGGCRTHADCGELPCRRVPDEPGGWGLCVRPLPEATGCSSRFDECCTSADCNAVAGGGCYRGVPWCGVPNDYPRCFYDTCENDWDCGAGDGLCLPAWVNENPRRECLSVDCRVDTDCNLRPGGRCFPEPSPCCPPEIIVTFACVYEGDPCITDADCPSNHVCIIDWNGSACVDAFDILCPA